MATDIIARGMITEYKSGTNIDFKENEDGSVTISASGDVSSEDTVARDTIDNHKLDKNNPHNVTAEQVGLGNVNNTADLDKPISTAVQTALNDKANTKHTHKKSDITDFPNSLPANGGDADTVNHHTVDSDVPANAVFTDTTNSDVTASGNPVQIDGLQGGVPFSEMVVSGKNLIDPAQAKALTGDNTNGFFISDSTASRVIVQKLQPNTTYRIKKYDSGNRFRIVMFNNEPTNAADTTAIQLIYKDDGSISDYTLTTGEDHLWMALATNYATSGEAIEPIVQLELGGTATAYEPPITGRELTVNASGKNLLQKMTDKTTGGLHYSPNDDGSVSVTGTQTTENYPNITSTSGMLLKAGNYTLSGGTERLQITALDIDANTVIARAKIAPATFSIDTDKYIRIYVYSSGTYNSQTFDDVIYPQLEIGSVSTPYEPYHGSTSTITPDSNPYTIPNDIRQQDGLNVVSVSEGELSVTGVRKNAALKKLWDEMGMDLLFDGTVTTGTNCITDNVNGYNFLYFYGNLSSVSGTSGNVTGSLVVPKTARAISAGQSLVVTTGVTYITVNIINIESGVITFTVTPNDSSREIYEFKIYGIK